MGSRAWHAGHRLGLVLGLLALIAGAPVQGQSRGKPSETVPRIVQVVKYQFICTAPTCQGNRLLAEDDCPNARAVTALLLQEAGTGKNGQELKDAVRARFPKTVAPKPIPVSWEARNIRKLYPDLAPYYEDLSEVILEPVVDPEAWEHPEHRRAYRVAQEHPELLAQLPCLCGCKLYGHPSLQFCFTDEHSTECPLCRREALQAIQWHQESVPIPEIRLRLVRQILGPPKTEVKPPKP